jgi:hypothetical protein
MSEARGQVIIAKVLSVLFFLGAIAVGAAIWNSYRNSLESPTWPSANGEVLESRIVGVGGGRGESGVRADIRYLYQVDGVQYRGSRVTYQRRRGDLAEEYAQAVMERYPVGGPVRVYYRPNHPNTSVLEPGQARKPVGGLILVLIILTSARVLWRDPSVLRAPIRRHSVRGRSRNRRAP